MLKTKDLISERTGKFLATAMADEMYASHLYRYVSNKLQFIGFFGAQKYFKKESENELTHFDKIAQFYNDMNCVSPMPLVPKIEDKIDSLADALEIYYKAEYNLLEKYEKAYIYANASDVVTAQFLFQFLEIQRESVGEASDLIARYNQSEGSKAAIIELDEYMSEL